MDTHDFDELVLRVASPEKIREWSYGEVTKPETINYRTGRSERGGLFDERIFGPEKDYECYCGKYRRIRYKDIICEKCGVEVTRSIVRRERMGHIELASPVAHIWFLRGVPSRIGLILDTPVADLEKVIYFAGYIVTKVNDEEKAKVVKNLEAEYKSKVKNLQEQKDREKLKELLTAAKKEIGGIEEGKVFDELTYHRYAMKYSAVFEAHIGAEAIYNIFKSIDFPKLRDRLTASLEKASALEREKLEKRLALVKSMMQSKLRPEWMFLQAVPVIPPGLRPMVALEGGRHATSDVNDLYRRVINRNNRLKKLLEIGAPEVILRNEKRILQEAVDSLIDNSIRRQSESVAMSQAQKRQLKSLSDNLKGKQGLFRQNLLGKRVDYSGRSVIVVGPTLKLSECGLPKHMALELFRPFVISKILEQELAYNIRGAGKLIDEGIPEVWAILEEVIKDKYVLLNRAPTLHRLGIQAFTPTLIEGNAIQVHPLVCAAFNADFDGDQMAVHVPLSEEAQAEAREFMAANKNLLKPGNGEPIVNPKLDIVLGCYWMTTIIPGEQGEGKIFASPNAAITAYDFGVVGFRAKVKVMASDKPKYKQFGGGIFETSVGRLLFNSILPEDLTYVNEEMNVKKLANLVDDLIMHYGIDATPRILDKIKDFGYRYISVSGITWGIDDVKVNEKKPAIVERGRKQADEVQEQFNEGLLSEDERYRKTIEIWQGVKNEIEKLIPETLKKHGPVYDMVNSGARGSLNQVGQMSGMKGLIVNTAGRTIDFPVIPSYKEGLSPLEYFITTHGARKGLADTALNTAKAGYLTRRLVDVAQDAVITEEDCGTKEGIVVRSGSAAGIPMPISKQIRGRVLAEEVKGNGGLPAAPGAAQAGTTLYKRGHLVSKDDAAAIEGTGVAEVKVRSPLTCKTIYGICRHCYGIDLGRNSLVKLGEAVGIIAAQAIGEPGTQLTMRTFHAGGVAGIDITMGLPRVEEIFERRTPKNPAVVAHSAGLVTEIKEEGKEKLIKVLEDLPLGQAGEGESTSERGRAGKKGAEKEVEYIAAFRRMPLVKVGDKVAKGELLTDGSAEIGDIFKYGGKEAAEEYVISEVNRVYELNGASISRKHIEVIIRQMFSRRKIKSGGDTKFAPGEIVENVEYQLENERMKEEGKEPAKGETLILGISEVSLSTKSWLSAASFQNTTRVLIANAVKGGVDAIRGLKENVIIGRLIPAGTGFGTRREEEDEGEDE
ncbi:MAG: DNA-directed RNA polymerase subunit beta' [bacterium]|nr:DNA-directed RNA polymerase subunit beta' [bacterium]